MTFITGTDGSSTPMETTTLASGSMENAAVLENLWTKQGELMKDSGSTANIWGLENMQ